MEVLQVESEFASLRKLYRTTKPQRVLEIGAWDGGTLREWLTNASPARVVTVDLFHRNPDSYAGWKRPATELHVITGSSLDDDTQQLIRSFGPFDWLFVDGDHTEPAVRSDVALARSVAADDAILVLHDIERGILNEGDPAPRVVFEELRREGFRVEEFVERPYDGPWAHGIGVVWL